MPACKPPELSAGEARLQPRPFGRRQGLQHPTLASRRLKRPLADEPHPLATALDEHAAPLAEVAAPVAEAIRLVGIAALDTVLVRVQVRQQAVHFLVTDLFDVAGFDHDRPPRRLARSLPAPRTFIMIGRPNGILGDPPRWQQPSAHAAHPAPPPRPQARRLGETPRP